MAKQSKGPGPVPPVARPAPKGASTSGETVTVACKLPNGLIIRGFRPTEEDVQVIGGGVRRRKFFEEDGRRVHIYGNARPKGGNFKTRVVCGYALTQGVPKDLWDQWYEANKDQPMVRNRLIFAYESTEMTVDAARDGRKQRSGLEPLNPKIEEDPRTPGVNPLTPDVGKLEMETERMKRDAFEQVDDEEAA